MPQHEHKDLLRNVWIPNEGKDISDKGLNIQDQDHMSTFIYHKGTSYKSNQPVLYDKNNEDDGSINKDTVKEVGEILDNN